MSQRSNPATPGRPVTQLARRPRAGGVEQQLARALRNARATLMPLDDEQTRKNRDAVRDDAAALGIVLAELPAPSGSRENLS